MEQQNEHHELVEKLKQAGREELIWLAGYFSGQSKVNQQLAQVFGKVANLPNISDFETIAQIVDSDILSKSVEGKAPGLLEQPTSPSGSSAQPTKELTLLFGSHSGNGKSFANTAQQIAEARGYKVKLADMNNYNTRDLKKERNLLVIISTHGEGDPPTQAEEVYEYIHGKKAPNLTGVNFSVLALGDKSYVHFCKTGIDFDTQLEKLGGSRIFNRVDCDVDFEDDADKWLSGVLETLDEQYGNTIAQDPSVAVKTETKKDEGKRYTQKNPFMAEVLTNINLNGKGSPKETYHVEISLEGSGIKYEAGDACGILGDNSDRIVEEFLHAAGLSGIENVYLAEGGVLLQTALKNHFELTVLTTDVIKKHNERVKAAALTEILNDGNKLKEYVYGRDVVDLFKEYPVRYTPQEILELLRPMPARLYSIASTQSVYDDEVHLLVSAVRYNAHGRYKEGSASTFVADRMKVDQKVPVYIKKNGAFRLPDDNHVPIIMVGPGTGVAPFRAFIDERGARGAEGKNWLFFGNPHFTTDFLYQTEFQKHLKSGLLTRMDVAFSRDQENKIYVQHKIEQQSKELINWLEEGAIVYVCGDMHYMAPDVQEAFTKVVQTEKNISHDKALEYVRNLKKNYRYLEDVY